MDVVAQVFLGTAQKYFTQQQLILPSYEELCQKRSCQVKLLSTETQLCFRTFTMWCCVILGRRNHRFSPCWNRKIPFPRWAGENWKSKSMIQIWTVQITNSGNDLREASLTPAFSSSVCRVLPAAQEGKLEEKTHNSDDVWLFHKRKIKAGQGSSEKNNYMEHVAGFRFH